MSGTEVLLDARLLEAPEPLLRATATLETLAPGCFLHMIHRRRPELLYPQLAADGFSVETLETEPGCFHILIWRDGDEPAAAAAVACGETLEAGG